MLEISYRPISDVYIIPDVQNLPQQVQLPATAIPNPFTGSSARSELREFEIGRAKEEIRDLARLKENWDGYGALPILQQTETNALTAAEVVFKFAPIPEIYSNPNGTISMEWETEHGSGYLEIGRTRYSFYIDRAGSAPIFAAGQSDEVTSFLGILIASVLFPVPGTVASTTSFDATT